MTVSDELSDELDRIRARLTALEHRVDSEASLRAMMDLDQSTLTRRFDAQDKLLRALAVTQSEHTAQLRRHTEILDSHTEILNSHTQILNSHTEILGRHSQALDLVQAGIRDILTLLQNGGPAGGAG